MEKLSQTFKEISNFVKNLPSEPENLHSVQFLQKNCALHDK